MFELLQIQIQSINFDNPQRIAHKIFLILKEKRTFDYVFKPIIQKIKWKIYIMHEDSEFWQIYFYFFGKQKNFLLGPKMTKKKKLLQQTQFRLINQEWD